MYIYIIDLLGRIISDIADIFRVLESFKTDHTLAQVIHLEVILFQLESQKQLYRVIN